MDISYENAIQKFITNVGLITTDGPYGPNVMACEWTHLVSYSPGLIVVCIRPHKATAQNIMKTKEFGVNICSVDQSVMSSVSGHYTGKEYNKIEALKELGFKFFSAKKIKTLMVEGSAANIECKLIKFVDIGDHPLFIGEMVDISINPKEPLAYHQGEYWIMDKNVEKPSKEVREKIINIVEKHKKKS